MRAPRPLVLGCLALIGLLAPGAAGQVLQEGDIVVSDRGGDAVVRIRLGPTAEQTVLKSGLSSVRGILADPFGSLFLTDSVNDLVLRLDPDTDVLGIVAGPSGFEVPEEVVFEASGDLLVAEPWIQGIWRLDPVVGNPEIVYADPNNPQSEFTLGFPEGLALDPANETLYITDTSSATPAVYKIELSLPLAERTIEPVSVNQYFQTPKDVALEPDGKLLVADRFAQTIFRVDPAEPYDNNQEVVVTGLLAPVGLYVYPNGDFLVADFEAGAVHLYPHAGGTPIDTYTGQLVGPWRITVVGTLESRGQLLVADTDQAELYRLTPDPADPTAATRLPVDHEIGLEAPAGIAVDTDGTVLLCDGGEPPSPEQALLRVNPATPPGGDEIVSAGEPLASPNRVVVHEIEGVTVYFVADPDAGAILRVEAGTATVLEPDEGQDYLVEPVALAIDEDGLLVVLNRDVDAENPEDRTPVVRVNPKTGFQNPLPLVPNLIEEIVNPVDLAIDENGDILLADRGDQDQDLAPIIFRLQGQTGAVQLKSYQSNLFHTLEGIAFDVNRELLVTDSGDPGADPLIPAAVIRIDTTSGSASIVENDEEETWTRPNGIALDKPAAPPNLADADGDTVADRLDNCQEVRNPALIDTNQDGIGNRCDADYNNDGVVDMKDWVLLGIAWGAVPGDPDYDPDIDSSPEAEIGVGEYGIGMPEYILLGQHWGRDYSEEPQPGLPGCDGTTIPCPAP